MLEALTALPLIWACSYGLAAGARYSIYLLCYYKSTNADAKGAARGGWSRLQLPECRRLNVALAASSIWYSIYLLYHMLYKYKSTNTD